MPHPLAEDLDHVLAHTAEVWRALRDQTIFITGGTGFVGTWLTESLIWANEHLELGVRAVLLTRRPDRFQAKAPHVARHKSVELLRGEAQDFSFPAGDFPFVIHAATEEHFEATSEYPVSTFDADISGTRHVLEFARTHGARRFLFTSSGAVYGKQPPELPNISEEYAGAPFTADPATAYGQGKRVSEFLCTMYARQYGFVALLGRLFAFVGPHLALDANYAVGNFIRDVLRGGPVRIAGDGTAQRSYLYAADLAIWLWTILIHGESARPYNVGSPQAISVAELAQCVVDATVVGTPIEILRRPGIPAGRYVPCTERAEKELGLRTWIPLAEGVRRTCLWCRQG
jgi:dTDP-glucose 4,6-dehydratase